MQYERTFYFSSSHFNSLQAYKSVWAYHDGDDTVEKQDVLSALRDIHGHNFRVVVLLEGQSFNRLSDWLVDDVDLGKIVMEWSNTNLSMHPDFLNLKMRATTERMAEVLYHKLGNRLPTDVSCLSVRVYENEDIFAEES